MTADEVARPPVARRGPRGRYAPGRVPRASGGEELGAVAPFCAPTPRRAPAADDGKAATDWNERLAGAEHAALQLLAYGIDTQRVRLQWRTPFWEWLNRIADTDSHDKAPDNWEPGMANHGGADAISVESIAEWAHEGQKALAGAVMMLAEAIRWGRQLEAEDDAKTAAEVVVNAVAQFPYRVAEAFADTAQMHQGAIVQRVVAETTAMQTESTISRAAGDRIRSVLRG